MKLHDYRLKYCQPHTQVIVNCSFDPKCLLHPFITFCCQFATPKPTINTYTDAAISQQTTPYPTTPVIPKFLRERKKIMHYPRAFISIILIFLALTHRRRFAFAKLFLGLRVTFESK
jgi:hypothetical protein